MLTNNISILVLMLQDNFSLTDLDGKTMKSHKIGSLLKMSISRCIVKTKFNKMQKF